MSMTATLSVLPMKIKADVEEELYRDYIARCARYITENTARLSGGGYMKRDFADILSPKPKENKKPEDIIADIVASAGLEVI